MLVTLLGRKKVKHSAIFRQTIVFTAITMSIVLTIVGIVRIVFVQFTLQSYNDMYIAQLNVSGLNRGNANNPQEPLDLLYQIMQDSSVLRRSLLSNRIVILDGQLISDPYGLIKENFKIPRLPYLYESDGMYYIFAGIPIFGSSLLIVGGPSLELTALLRNFEKAVFVIITTGFFISLLVSYFLAKSTLKPVVKMAEQISEIDANTIDKRISEQKSQEFDIFAQKLNSMLDRIENAFEIQNQFVSDVSHELRTPLTSINGYIKMLKRWGKNDPKIMEESLNSIEASSEYLRDLVEQLLLLTKNDYQIEKESIDIKNVVEETLNLFKLELDEFKIDIQGESFTVNSSNEYLSLILKIFIENAIKYSSNQKEITIKLDPNQKSISIQDHGIGIEQTKLKNIFERFYKVDFSRSDKGHGLGLSIAKKLADALDIELKAYSELGKGSTFTLIFLNQL